MSSDSLPSPSDSIPSSSSSPTSASSFPHPDADELTHLKFYVSKLEKQLSFYHTKYPSNIPADTLLSSSLSSSSSLSPLSSTSSSSPSSSSYIDSNEYSPPWLSSSKYQSPLLISYENRQNELEKLLVESQKREMLKDSQLIKANEMIQKLEDEIEKTIQTALSAPMGIHNSSAPISSVPSFSSPLSSLPSASSSPSPSSYLLSSPSDMSTTIHLLQDHVDHLSQQERSLIQQIHDVTNYYEKLLSDVKSAETLKLEDLNNKLNDRERELSTLKSSKELYEKGNTEYHQLISKLDDLNKQKIELSNKLLSATNENTKIKDSHLSLSTQHEHLTHQHDDIIASLSKMEYNYLANQKKSHALEEKYHLLMNEAEGLKVVRDIVEEKEKRYKEEISLWKDKSLDMERGYAERYIQQTKSIEKEKEINENKWKEMVQKVEGEKVVMGIEIQKLKEEKKSFEGKLREADNLVKDITISYRKKAEIIELKIIESEGNVRRKEEELKSQYHENVLYKDLHQKSVEDSRHVIQQLRDKLSSHHDEYEKLHRDYHSFKMGKDQIIEEMKNTIREREKRINEIDGEMRILREDEKVLSVSYKKSKSELLLLMENMNHKYNILYQELKEYEKMMKEKEGEWGQQIFALKKKLEMAEEEKRVLENEFHRYTSEAVSERTLLSDHLNTLDDEKSSLFHQFQSLLKLNEKYKGKCDREAERALEEEKFRKSLERKCDEMDMEKEKIRMKYTEIKDKYDNIMERIREQEEMKREREREEMEETLMRRTLDQPLQMAFGTGRFEVMREESEKEKENPNGKGGGGGKGKGRVKTANESKSSSSSSFSSLTRLVDSHMKRLYKNKKSHTETVETEEDHHHNSHTPHHHDDHHLYSHEKESESKENDSDLDHLMIMEMKRRAREQMRSQGGKGELPIVVVDMRSQKNIQHELLQHQQQEEQHQHEQGHHNEHEPEPDYANEFENARGGHVETEEEVAVEDDF